MFFFFLIKNQQSRVTNSLFFSLVMGKRVLVHMLGKHVVFGHAIAFSVTGQGIKHTKVMNGNIILHPVICMDNSVNHDIFLQ